MSVACGLKLCHCALKPCAFAGCLDAREPGRSYCRTCRLRLHRDAELRRKQKAKDFAARLRAQGGGPAVLLFLAGCVSSTAPNVVRDLHRSGPDLVLERCDLHVRQNGNLEWIHCRQEIAPSE